VTFLLVKTGYSATLWSYLGVTVIGIIMFWHDTILAVQDVKLMEMPAGMSILIPISKFAFRPFVMYASHDIYAMTCSPLIVAGKDNQILVNLILIKPLEIPLTGIGVGQSRIFAAGM
jgi:hypothetical protein